MIGCPDAEHISTSYVERANLSMRMGMRRFTRLTNAFSKKIENHGAAVALYFMYYNFARVHTTLRCSPAMAAGVDYRLWDIKDIVAMIEAYENSNCTLPGIWDWGLGTSLPQPQVPSPPLVRSQKRSQLRRQAFPLGNAQVDSFQRLG